ncbi:MAG: hypothetical protein J0H86_00090 [Xanthomonadaceae bacterium]|nr:hypothetical protein [Xanthomonadaceae bacterium]
MRYYVVFANEDNFLRQIRCERLRRHAWGSEKKDGAAIVGRIQGESKKVIRTSEREPPFEVDRVGER